MKHLYLTDWEVLDWMTFAGSSYLGIWWATPVEKQCGPSARGDQAAKEVWGVLLFPSQATALHSSVFTGHVSPPPQGDRSCAPCGKLLGDHTAWECGVCSEGLQLQYTWGVPPSGPSKTPRARIQAGSPVVCADLPSVVRTTCISPHSFIGGYRWQASHLLKNHKATHILSLEGFEKSFLHKLFINTNEKKNTQMSCGEWGVSRHSQQPSKRI